MSFTTCDLSDANEGKVSVVTGYTWFNYGGRRAFGGEVVTVKCFEDNSRIKEVLGTPGQNKVLVVDGGGSLRNALVGDMLGESAVRNTWEGVILFGVCRDVDALAKLDLGILALGSVPIKSVRRGEGQLNVEIRFGGASFKPGQYAYADNNGILVANEKLL